MRRVILIIVGLLWYCATITFVAGFISSCFGGELIIDDKLLDTLIKYYFITWLLGLWQSFFVWATVKLYGGVYSAKINLGIIGLLANGQILACIIVLVLSPVLLIPHLFLSLKPMWLLIRHSPN